MKEQLRTSICMTAETQRQLTAICRLHKENRSQTITRCIQIVYSSLKLNNRIIDKKDKDDDI